MCDKNCCKKVVITERGERGPQGIQGVQGPQGEPGQTCNAQINIIPTENPLQFKALIPVGLTVDTYQWAINTNSTTSFAIDSVSINATETTVTLTDNTEISPGAGLLRLRMEFTTGCIASDYYLVLLLRA